MLKPDFDKLCGCLIAGAIGDCVGSYYENKTSPIIDTDFNHEWQISDDTQLTLATCEAIIAGQGKVKPELIASRFLYWFNNRKITGIGASTLKALRDLQVGQHWAYAGREGEHAAGNGAAMRIAPLAFCLDYNTDRTIINDVCSITHRNDEAYLGALAILIAIDYARHRTNNDLLGLMPMIIDIIADSHLRDRLIAINETPAGTTIQDIARQFGTSGYVVDSVPLAIFAAQQYGQLDLKTIFIALIRSGGDTDTICSMTGQILGTLIGAQRLPADLVKSLMQINEYSLITTILDDWNTVL